MGTFEATDDPTGAFPFYKARILQVIQESMGKGWITKDEVLDAAMGKTISTPEKIKPIKPPKVKPGAVQPVLPPPPPEEVKMTDEDLQTKITELEDIMDESSKTGSIKKLERALDAIDEDQVSGLGELRDAIQEYKDIEKTDKTLQEYAQEKDDAFETIINAINDLELVES